MTLLKYEKNKTSFAHGARSKFCKNFFPNIDFETLSKSLADNCNHFTGFGFVEV